MSFGVIVAPLGPQVAEPMRKAMEEMRSAGLHVQWDDRALPIEMKKQQWRDAGECSCALIASHEFEHDGTVSIWSLEDGFWCPNGIELREALDFIYNAAGVESPVAQVAEHVGEVEAVADPEPEERTQMAAAFATATAEPGGVPTARRPEPQAAVEQIPSWPVGDESWRDALSNARIAAIANQVRAGKLTPNAIQAIVYGDRIYLSVKAVSEALGLDHSTTFMARMQRALHAGKTELDGYRIGYADEGLEQLRLGFSPAKEPLTPVEPAEESARNLVAMIVRGTSGELEFDRDFTEAEANMIVAFCKRVVEKREQPEKRVRL